MIYYIINDPVSYQLQDIALKLPTRLQAGSPISLTGVHLSSDRNSY